MEVYKCSAHGYPVEAKESIMILSPPSSLSTICFHGSNPNARISSGTHESILVTSSCSTSSETGIKGAGLMPASIIIS